MVLVFVSSPSSCRCRFVHNCSPCKLHLLGWPDKQKLFHRMDSLYSHALTPELLLCLQTSTLYDLALGRPRDRVSQGRRETVPPSGQPNLERAKHPFHNFTRELHRCPIEHARCAQNVQGRNVHLSARQGSCRVDLWAAEQRSCS